MEHSAATLPLPPSSDAGQVPRLRGGRYRLVRLIGRGGSGAVYLARDPDGRRVALKVLSAGAGPEELLRLAREARLAARLDHPALVRVEGLGVQEGRPFLVMEYVPGGTLQARLARGPLPPERARSIACALARGLHHAHERGVLHRDVKPANVLLDRDGAPRLTDFGLARPLQRRLPQGRGLTLTREGDLLGTPSYMAPEQALGESGRVDRRTDVYGLGATLYAMLTGRPPFAGGTWLRVLADVVHVAPRPPSERARGLDPCLESVCLRCLAKAPTERYASAHALAEALERCADAPWRPRPLRPHGESERLLALHSRRAQPFLLLAGEDLGLRPESPRRRRRPPPLRPRGRTRRRRRRPRRVRRVGLAGPLLAILLLAAAAAYFVCTRGASSRRAGSPTAAAPGGFPR
ncbi:MAG: serine/threonine protein kinase [Planctomycetota bacterium]|nr:MAG: serine/threonine protein kinase [Planctomycetota bacterium]